MDAIFKNVYQIGDKLKKRRKALKKTQVELGEFLGCTPQQIQKYEKGLTRISISVFLKICEFLNTPPNYFFPIQTFNEDSESMDDDILEERLLEYFRSVNNKKVKERIINLIEALTASLNNEQ